LRRGRTPTARARTPSSTQPCDKSSRRAARDERAKTCVSRYLRVALGLASALFFAGVTASFKMQMARLVLLGLAPVLIAYCLSRIATLPVS